MNTAPHKVYKKRSSTRGFTLVETLVAITIFITVIVGPLTIAWSSMRRAYFANEQTTAIFLAQEALESIRLQRDNQGLETYESIEIEKGGMSWEWVNGSRLNDCKNVSTGCDLNRSLSGGGSDSYIPCPTRGCQLKQFESSSGSDLSQSSFTYGYGMGSQWKESPYYRKIVVTDEGGEAARVVVTVTWKPSLFNIDQSVILESWLYNQYKRFE